MQAYYAGGHPHLDIRISTDLEHAVRGEVVILVGVGAPGRVWCVYSVHDTIFNKPSHQYLGPGRVLPAAVW